MRKYTLDRERFNALVNTGQLDGGTYTWTINGSTEGFVSDLVFVRRGEGTDVTFWQFLPADWGHSAICTLTQVDRVVEISWKVIP